MRKITRKNNHSNQSIATNEKGEKTMSKINRKANNATNSNNNSNHALQAAQILAALNPSILAAIGLTPAKVNKNLEEKASEASEAKSQKADRVYEIPSISADFVKSGIYAKPKSEEAGRYVSKAKALCEDVIDNLTAPIVNDVKAIADKAEKNGGESLKNDLLQLAEKWEISPQSMRIVMQLCAPVVGVCNPETDEIARRVYGMARANALMGSACNTLMHSKAADKEKALPFKRVAHNCTSLGLDFEECAFVGECDFCDNDEDFEELVGLCDMWLNKCTRKSATTEPKSSPRRAAKAPKAEPAAAPQNDIASLLAAITNQLGIK